jgi:regulator of protease activity HflC (stomatin/prohibitin superfamily)
VKFLRRIAGALRRVGYLVRATAWATLLGLIETVTTSRGRRVLAALALCGAAIAFALSEPIQSIEPGEVGIRVNRITGGLSRLEEGWAWELPGIHRLRRVPLRDQVYRPAKANAADGDSPYQSVEGLAIGVEVGIRYAFDEKAAEQLALTLPVNMAADLIEPVADGVLHRTFAKHTVRQIFSSERTAIETAIKEELGAVLARDGVIIRDVFLGNVDLPADYRAGLESLLSEELSAEKMRYTLELREKQIAESELAAKAQRAQREVAAETAASEEIIAAKGRAEAMKHILPLKEREIEQRRLEAEASAVQRIKLAEGEAGARRIESKAEADSRRTLAEADAYRLEVTGKAQHEQLARDSTLIAKNPLLIQKTLADKLSDKIQVIIAPPESGFFAAGLLGGKTANATSVGEDDGGESY